MERSRSNSNNSFEIASGQRGGSSLLNSLKIAGEGSGSSFFLNSNNLFKMLVWRLAYILNSNNSLKIAGGQGSGSQSTYLILIIHSS
jgi:hypothetical protein